MAPIPHGGRALPSLHTVSNLGGVDRVVANDALPHAAVGDLRREHDSARVRSGRVEGETAPP